MNNEFTARKAVTHGGLEPGCAHWAPLFSPPSDSTSVARLKSSLACDNADAVLASDSTQTRKKPLPDQ